MPPCPRRCCWWSRLRCCWAQPAVVAALLRRRTSAATRHLVWSLALVGALLLPMASFALPDWTFDDSAPRRRPPMPPRSSIGGTSPWPARARRCARRPSMQTLLPAGARRFNLSWPALIGAVYSAGVVGHADSRCSCNTRACGGSRARARATSSGPGMEPPARRVRARHGRAKRASALLRSREQSMPMTFGIRRPSILIPAIAETWTGDRRRAVILHELAHIARRDCLTQTLAFVACALVLVPSGRVVGRAAAADRTGARVRRPRDRGRHAAPRIRRSSARDRLLLRRSSRARRWPSAWRVRISSKAGCWRRSTTAATGPFRRLACAPPGRSSRRHCSWASPAPRRPLGMRRRPLRKANAPASPKPPASPPVRWRDVLTDLRDGAQQRVADRRRRDPDRAQENLPGTWELRPTEKEGVVHLRLMELNSSNGSNVPVDQLEGLTAAQLAGAGGPVQFRIRRDAGTFTFEGVLRNRVGGRHVLVFAQSELPGGARQTRVRPADRARAISDGAARHRVCLHRRAEQAGVRQAADRRARSRRSARRQRHLPAGDGRARLSARIARAPDHAARPRRHPRLRPRARRSGLQATPG